ncbi:hypothetical protein [Frigoribacterium sp. Leaf172]|uniref:hypothetical protein n=1 Tax=Frigoribacterium sp. Leaf172 TaxID=1736285 RepID=UPI0006F5DFDD|nr:hypothetical protein [Frigoribacterium sp. Leaf172]KQR66609.1 hypothetical protein ASF89_06035 [Frigoribacterium sp. Leaf172]
MPPAFPFDRVRPVMLRVVIASLIVAAAVAIVSIATSTFGDTSWRLIATAAVFAAFALFAWYDAAISSARSSWFALVGFAVSVYLFVAGMAKIWIIQPLDHADTIFDGFFGWLILAAIARVALAHVHVVLATEARLRSRVITAVTRVTLALVAILAVMLSVPVLFSPLELDGAYWRVLGVVAVLDALGTVLIPLGYQLFTPASARTRTLARVHPDAASSPAGAVPGFRPPAAAYAAIGAPLTLQWPKYADGADLPATPTGEPDFTGVVGYDDCVARTV